MEMGIPVTIALNMMDVAQKRGIEIDIKRLSALLNVPVIPTVARNGKGKKQLLKSIAQSVNVNFKPLNISYGLDIDTAIDEMELIINKHDFLTDKYRARWTAIKYLESDSQIIELGSDEDKHLALKLEKIVQRVTDHLNATLDTHPEGVIADQRYGYVNSILKQNVITFYQDRNRLQVSDKIDRVVTNRFLGPIIMMAVIMGFIRLRLPTLKFLWDGLKLFLDGSQTSQISYCLKDCSNLLSFQE